MMAGADVGLRLYWAGRYDEALAPIQNTLKLDPSFALAHRYLGQIYEQQGKYQQAITEFQTDSALTHENPISLAALAHAYAVSGDKRRALSLLARLKKVANQRYVSGYSIALVYAGLGQKDKAFAALEQAYLEHSTWMVQLKVDPRLNPLRSDRRFQDLVRRVGLASSSTAKVSSERPPA